jgi:hypothetical protein
MLALNGFAKCYQILLDKAVFVMLADVAFLACRIAGFSIKYQLHKQVGISAIKSKQKTVAVSVILNFSVIKSRIGMW